MEYRHQVPRNVAHKVSFRPALVNGRDSGELFITLRTRDCPWGKCLFCGLNRIDGDNKPLLYDEAVAQVRDSIKSYEFKRGDCRKVGMVSLITNSDSVFNPETVEKLSLLGMAAEIGGLPAVTELIFESRAEYLTSEALGWIRGRIAVFTSASLSVAVGIESPYEEVRKKNHKGLPSSLLFKAAKNAAGAGFGLRGYFVYNLLEPLGRTRLRNLEDSVGLMAQIASETGARTSMLVLRGYVPEKLAGTPLFRNFREVPDREALLDLQAAAAFAKANDVRFEVDSTTEDQENTGSRTWMSPAYRAALVRYNTTMDPLQLKL